MLQSWNPNCVDAWNLVQLVCLSFFTHRTVCNAAYFILYRKNCMQSTRVRNPEKWCIEFWASCMIITEVALNSSLKYSTVQIKLLHEVFSKIMSSCTTISSQCKVLLWELLKNKWCLVQWKCWMMLLPLTCSHSKRIEGQSHRVIYYREMVISQNWYKAGNDGKS